MLAIIEKFSITVEGDPVRLSQEDYEILEGAYQYLRWNDDNPSEGVAEFIKVPLSRLAYTDDKPEPYQIGEYVYYHCNDFDLDIAGYAHMKYVEGSSISDVFGLDLHDYMKQLVAERGTGNISSDIIMIDINENQKLVMTDLNLYVNAQGEPEGSFYWEGYLLER